MSAATNKQSIQDAFAAMAQGNTAPFGELMAEDFSWSVPGANKWSGTYRGKEEVRTKLFRQIFAQFATRYTNTAERILADGDYVVVQCRGNVMTKSGKPYNNAYCYVIRFADGKMREL